MGGEDRDNSAGEGGGIAVGDLVHDARTLSRDDFVDRHGAAFLMIGGMDLVVPDGPGSTVVEVDGADGQEAPHTTFKPRVHAIRRTGRSVGHLVSVGRTSNNDVVIADVSVSRFHAFLKEGRDDALWIQDAGSTNGTQINGRSVPVQGKGAAIALKSGDRLRIGHVDMTFLEADLLVRLLSGSGG